MDRMTEPIYISIYIDYTYETRHDNGEKVMFKVGILVKSGYGSILIGLTH